jgi:dihydroflavonol-4-reductase
MKKVGIIGGSGFIGSHITELFLKNNFQVKVSATNINREDKYEHLMGFKNADNLYISELDVENRAMLDEFITDCDYIIHAGTPFILDFYDAEKQLFNPTVRGTENFLELISRSSNIKKVVIIASVAGWNTNFPLPADGKDFNDTYDETQLRYTSTESHPYAQAKFLANQVVCNFIEEHLSLSFEISTVSPTFVIGKSLSNREDSTSSGMQFLIKNRIAPNDFVQFLYDTDVPFAMVDVKDVAQAVFNAALTEGLHGKDYLLSSETYKTSDIHEMLNNRAPKNRPQIIYKNDLAKKDLGIQFKPVEETLNNF